LVLGRSRRRQWLRAIDSVLSHGLESQERMAMKPMFLRDVEQDPQPGRYLDSLEDEADRLRVRSG